MRNNFLRDRASSRGIARDGRNPYGSRGGYVTSSRRGRDRGDMRDYRGRDRGMDSRDYYSEHDSRNDYRGNSYDRGQDYHMGYEHAREHSRPMEYEMYGIGGMRPRMDYGDYQDHGDYRDYRDYRDYQDHGDYRDYGEDSEKEYEEELKKWTEKLKKEDRFGWSKEQIMQQAKSMGVKFEEYDENEFYATYLMMISDYPKSANEPHSYLAMAKAFLEDKDAKLKGSDKLCAYLYTIVLDK